MNEQTIPGDFRSQVQHLVAAGKLTADEAACLLEGAALENTLLEGAAPGGVPDLRLDITGYSLNVVVDSQLGAPQLSANREGELSLSATETGWQVRRIGLQDENWSGLRAILSLPFVPQAVQATVSGGTLNLPSISGEMRTEIHGGHVRMDGAVSLWAQVSGGNLNAGEISGPTHLSVSGGNLTLTGAQSLNASINGGNLNWAGTLSSGEHRVEVSAGNVSLQLLPGSSVQLVADVSVGSFKTDFPVDKRGGLVKTIYSGQLGSGEARLSCQVAAGQIKVVTQ